MSSLSSIGRSRPSRPSIEEHYDLARNVREFPRERGDPPTKTRTRRVPMMERSSIENRALRSKNVSLCSTKGVMNGVIHSSTAPHLSPDQTPQKKMKESYEGN